MMNIFLLDRPNHKYRIKFKELKDKLTKDRAALKRLESARKALVIEMGNIPTMQESKVTDAAVQRHKQILEELEHERTVRLAQLHLPVSEQEQKTTEFLDSVVESRNRQEIELDKLLNRAQIEGFDDVIREVERKMQQLKIKSWNADPQAKRRLDKSKQQLSDFREKLLTLKKKSESAATGSTTAEASHGDRVTGIQAQIAATEAELDSLRTNRPWLRERVQLIFHLSRQVEDPTIEFTFSGQALDTCIKALLYCSLQLKDLVWKVISNGFHHIERHLFDDIRMCWHMCALLLHRFYTADSPSGALPETLPTVETSSWSLPTLMSVVGKLWSPDGIVNNFPDERHDDPYYLARFYDEFGVLANDGTEGKNGFVSDSFHSYFDCIRPQKHQPETGKDVLLEMLQSKAPGNIMGLAVTIQTFFTLGCYLDSRPCLLPQEDLGRLLDLYSRRNRVRPIEQEMVEEFYLDTNHYIVGLLASKEYINYAYNQALPAMSEMSPKIVKYRTEIRTVCDKWRSERTTVYITPALYKEMKKLKSKMADYGATLRYPCGFWWMVDRKHREGKTKSNRKKKDDGSTQRSRQSRSLAARYVLELRKQRGLPVGVDLDEQVKDGEQKEQNKQFAVLQKSHWLFTSEALIDARAEIIAWLTHPEITSWEKGVMDLAEVLPYQQADFVAVWRFGILAGLHLQMTREDETMMLLLMIDFYCKRLGPSTTESAIREVCRNSMPIRAISVLWNSFFLTVQTPVPTQAVVRQNTALFNRMSAFFTSQDQFPGNTDYLLFCTVCGMIMTIVNYSFQIGRREPAEIQVATDVMGFTGTTIKFRETRKVMCGRTGTAAAMQCRESECKFVPMIHRITYQNGKAFVCCAKCFIAMTIASFYTLYHSKYWALCSYCALHIGVDTGPDYPHPISRLASANTSSMAIGIVGTYQEVPQ